MSILSQQKQSVNTDFPNIRPSLDLRFALAKKLDPRVTFSRGSTGTYFGPDSLMKVASANEPRFDHDPVTGQSLGLLIEESRQNLLLRSEDFTTTWLVTNASIQSNVITAPDGNITADKLVENSLTNTKEVTQGSITFTSGTSLTFSCFVKAGERTLFRLAATTGFFASQTNAYFNLTSGTVSLTQGGITSASIIPYPNGWYRCVATMLPTSSGTGNVFITLVRSGTTNNYTGDGTSGIYIWGAQLEAGAFPTSYIPTSGSTVTRSADNANMTGTNFSSWYNQTEGTIYLETDKLYPGNFDGYRHPYRIDSGSNADQITAYTLPGATTITNYGIISGGRQVNDYQQINIGSNPIRYKLGQSVNTKYFFFTTSTGRVPPQLPSRSSPNTHNLSLATNMNRLFIGSNAGGGQINSHIARFTYYPIQITNQQLINLTS